MEYAEIASILRCFSKIIFYNKHTINQSVSVLLSMLNGCYSFIFIHLISEFYNVRASNATKKLQIAIKSNLKLTQSATEKGQKSHLKLKIK